MTLSFVWNKMILVLKWEPSNYWKFRTLLFFWEQNFYVSDVEFRTKRRKSGWRSTQVSISTIQRIHSIERGTMENKFWKMTAGSGYSLIIFLGRGLFCRYSLRMKVNRKVYFDALSNHAPLLPFVLSWTIKRPKLNLLVTRFVSRCAQ